MEIVSLVVNFLVLTLVFYFTFLKKYFEKKGENLATKEDIAEITEKIEEVKIKYVSESHMLIKKRETYEKIARDLQVFIIGRESYDERKNEMLESYSIAWLWAGDYLIRALNKHIELQEKVAVGEPVSQKDLKESFANCMLLMRKETGYKETELKDNNFKFFKFT